MTRAICISLAMAAWTYAGIYTGIIVTDGAGPLVALVGSSVFAALAIDRIIP